MGVLACLSEFTLILERADVYQWPSNADSEAKLEEYFTAKHFDAMCKLVLLTGSILFYAYAMEYFVGWYSGNIFEQTTFYRRAFGPYWWAGWTMIICNAFVSQLLWFRKVRTNLTSLFVISIFINIGMWFERYVIIVSSLSNDYIPWAWDQLNPTWADWGILAGSFGWFGMWFLLFAKNFPIVAIQEIKEMIRGTAIATPTSTSCLDSSLPRERTVYQYDGAGNRLSEVTVRANATVQNATASWDALSRMTGWNEWGGASQPQASISQPAASFTEPSGIG